MTDRRAIADCIDPSALQAMPYTSDTLEPPMPRPYAGAFTKPTVVRPWRPVIKPATVKPAVKHVG